MTARSARWLRRFTVRGAQVRRTDDSGQIMLLSIGYAIICLLLVTVVVSASAVHLERKRLSALADTLAVAAADELAPDRYFDGGIEGPVAGAEIPLTDRAVRDAVAKHLKASPNADRFNELRVVRADAPDAHTARVRLTSRVAPTWSNWVLTAWSDGITLGVSSSARAW